MKKVLFAEPDSKTKFHFLAGINRAVDPSHVTKLANSVEKMGIIRPVVVVKTNIIDGTNKQYILDGQHLFYVCLRLNISIPYVYVEIENQKDLIEKIALLNASSKSWKLSDYVTAWSSINNEYKKLNKIFNTFDFDLGFLVSVLHFGSFNKEGGSFTTKVIKNGTFKIIDEEKKVAFLDSLTDVLRIVPRMGRVENKFFCSEFYKYYNFCGSDYNHKKVITFIKSHKENFEFTTQEENSIFTFLQKNIK